MLTGTVFVMSFSLFTCPHVHSPRLMSEHITDHTLLAVRTNAQKIIIKINVYEYTDEESNSTCNVNLLLKYLLSFLNHYRNGGVRMGVVYLVSSVC